MDVEYQYETFNGLPVYYGGDMCDSEELEEYDPLEMARAAYADDYNFDVPEGMELMTYTRSRPDGGETRGVDTVDMVSMCRTVSWVTHRVPDEPGGISETDTANIEELDIGGFCRCPDLWNEEDSSASSAGSNVDIGLGMSNQNGLNYVDVASMADLDASGVDSDEGSVAELEWKTWDDACAWEFRSASGNFPPDSNLGLPAGLLKDTGYYTEDGGYPDRHGHVRYEDSDISLSRLCLWQWPGLWDFRIRNDDNVNVRGLNHRLTICWHMDITDSCV